MSQAEVEATRQALQSIQTSLPPGANVFEAIHGFLVNGVFPDLGKPFWVQYYLNVAVFALAIALFVTSIIVKAARGRLHFIIHDGSCSRVDLKFAGPILWTIGAAFSIVFAISFKDNYDKHNITLFVGSLWYLCLIPPAVSFTLLSASLAAGTPPLRRYLNRVPYGTFRFNAAVGVCIACTIGSLVPPAVSHGKSLATISTTFARASAGVRAAEAANDLEALYAMADEIIALESVDGDYRRTSRIVNGIYVAYLSAYLITGVVSFVILRTVVYQKIARLEGDNHPALRPFGGDSRNRTADSERGGSPQDMQLKAISAMQTGSLIQIPRQPTDRPFAHLLGRGTSILPRRFHIILQASEEPFSKRAEQLRSTLDHDLKLLLAYLCTVISPLTLSLFLCSGGQDKLHIEKAWRLTYTWSVWNLAIPTIILAVMLLKDAAYPPPADASPALATKVHRRKKSGTFPVADLNLIQCEQVVDVAFTELGEEEGQSEKQDGRGKSEDVI